MIHGRLNKIMFKTGSTTTFSSLGNERTANLTISRAYVTGAGSTYRDASHYASLKTWNISSTFIMTFTNFRRFYNFVNAGTIATLQFGTSGMKYTGEAFPTKVTLTATVGEVVKLSVEWQGTGVLNVT